MKTYEERMQSVQGKIKKKQTQRKALMATAGMLCLCIVAGLLLPKGSNGGVPIEPGIDISQYSDSQYFKVIEAINRNFPNYNDQYRDNEDDLVANEVMLPPVVAAPGSNSDMGETWKPSTAAPNGSVEITDHQVAGVLEADIIKRSQTHIFYLKGNTLEVYPIAGLETKLLNTWCLKTDLDAFYYSTKMYLSADATRINLVISGFGDVFAKEKKSAFVQVVSLDVTDPANIKEANCLYVTGSLLSSRMVEDQMLLMAQYRMDSKVDFEEESTFLPQYGQPGDMQSISAENIVVPDKLAYNEYNKAYTVVILLDGKDMTVLDSGAFMSYSTKLYVSQERIYACRFSGMPAETIFENAYMATSMTEISCMSYSPDGLKIQGTFEVEGTIKDQYSMDEHDGIFRVLTSTYRAYRYYNNKTTATSATVDAQGNTAPPNSGAPIVDNVRIPRDSWNANLTCFKVGTWEKIAEVKDFAPEGEMVESVRFDGDYAYVCTAVVVTLTDPVFFFDMTDLDNIIVKDTGTIDGYSSSLIQLNDGFLMGIGFDENRCLKVEVYTETADGVEAVCAYTQWVSFASEYKAYYIDRENNLFGIPTNDGYILLQFDGYQLTELARTKFLGVLNNTRGVVIDKCLYAFGTDGYAVQELN